MGGLKRLVKRILFPNKWCSEAFVDYLRKNGAIVGENTYFFAPRTNTVDSGRLSYITIGNGCAITQGVELLCHDYSWTVLRKSHGAILPDPGKPIRIGDNVFLGWDTIVMGGVTIGNNVIVGAHSVVTKDIPDNCVYAGNPAKRICSLDEYYEKKKAAAIEDAFHRAHYVYEQKGRLPTVHEMGWFAVLFLERNADAEAHLRQLPFKADDMDEVIRSFYAMERSFNGFEDFISKAFPQGGASKNNA